MPDDRIELTNEEGQALINLLREAISDTSSNTKAALFASIVEKLQMAVVYTLPGDDK